TSVLSGSGVLAAAPTSVITRPADLPPRHPAAPGGTPPAGYYGHEGPPRRRRPIWPWILAILLLAAAGVAAWFAYTQIQKQLNNNKPVGIPDVVGLKEPQAIDKLHNFGFSAHILRDTSDTIPLGVVISQSPNAGTKVAKGTSVEVDISKGKEKVTVPSVLGKTEADAVSTLTNAGLRANVFSVHSNKPANTVTGQDPPVGTKIVKGSRVRINVSSGPAPVSVPYVVGQQYNAAAGQLQ